MSDKLFFNPVRGTEASIENFKITEGFIYFATDSGKIYLDTDKERIIAGGSGAAVLYSNAEKVIANTDDTYTILFSYLDDQNALPKAEDLIINSDGRFFRINYYDANAGLINCKLIAVSGTGGSSDGPDQEDDPRVIDVTYHDLTYTFLNGKEYTIDLTPFSQVDLYLNISYSVRNAQNYTTGFGSMQIKSGTRASLPVGQYITPDGGTHAVDITIEGANSKPYPKTINKIKCIDLKINNDLENFTSHQIYKGTVSYYVKVFGQINKTLYIDIDGKNLTKQNLGADEHDTSVRVPIDCQSIGLTAGVHTISAYLMADGVPSNTILTDFIYHPDGAADSVYVIVTEYPTECMSYETPAVYYWVYNTAQPDGYKNSITFMVDGSVVADDITAAQVPGESLRWNVTGLQPNSKNICEIICGSGSRSFEIYCRHSNIFEPTPGALLALSAEGRTNNTSLERRLDWHYTNDYNTTYTANLENFNWNNNGWKIDEDTGRDCLRISNGASVEIPLTLFTNAAPNTGGFTFEFEFKPYNLYSYNLLTQSTTTIKDENNKEDDVVEIIRDFNSDLAIISYIATDNNNKAYGLCCGTQDAFFRMSDGKNVTVRYTNDQVIHVAITVNAAKEQICMYVNGVMSGMVAYKRTSAKLPIYAEKLLINSEQCDLDLFNIRIYDQALTSKQIVQNYIANTKDMDIYNQNIFNATDETVSLAALQDYNEDNPSNATIPYMVFKTKSPDILPFNKANEDVICSIEFVNPALDYALAKGEIDEIYYKKHAPSFTVDEVAINVQGTSSQKYPRKNFKGKFKKAKNWQCREDSVNELIGDKSLSKFYMDDNIAEKTICWKADYMDSSSCHNTGFASFAQELYWNHPLDYYEGTNVAAANKEGQTGEYHKKYRTSLYGFPVLVFHQKSDGSTEFIGRYNFNLDKGADDTLGMALDKQHKVLTDKTYEKVCECWEMANNMGGRCSFRGNPFDYCYDYNHVNADGTVGAYMVDGKESQSDIGDDIEVRYHINSDAIEGAWDNLTKPLDDGGTPISSREAFEVLLGGDADGNNRTGAYAHLEKLFKWLQSCYYAFDMNTDEDKEWVTALLGHAPITDENGNYYDNEGIPLDPDFKELRNARKVKFESEFDKHLNKEYCMVYYILTELLLQYDSRGKNMMISSWGPIEDGGDYIWFPIFYDIDTQLGVNNSGIPSWEYNVEPTTGFNNPGGKKAFSTANSLLWNNFHQSYAVDRTDVRDYYRLLRGSTLTIPKINGYYNFDYNISKAYCMKGILPISIINANQNYKYIAPSTKGYVIGVDDAGAPEYRTTSAYFYCLQGTRELHRAQLLRNRFNYYDSKWMTQDYNPKGGGNTLRLRANAKTTGLGDDSLRSNLVLQVKPALDQYLVLWPDESATYVIPKFARGGESVTIDLMDLFSSETYSQQLIYIGGAKYIQEIGNISLLYVDEYEFPKDSSNMVKIELGNENPLYKPNEQFKAEAIDEATENKSLLKVFDITNIDKIDSKIELLSSIKLETFKALGSKITGALFADGVNLRHLYLPNTITSLVLSKAANLTKVIYNSNELKTELEDGSLIDTEGLYIENVIKDVDGSKTTNISEINIIGGGLKLYSYELLEKITNAVNDMIGSTGNGILSINMEDVQWTPYIQLGEGAIYEENNKVNYKYATNNYSYRDYVYDNESQWNLDLLNGRIYEYVASPVAAPINLDILNIYLEQDKINNMPKHFTNITETALKTLPVISGELYIDNTNYEAISEADIANIYNVAFPSLSIKAAKIADAYRARFVRVDNNIESEIKVLRFNPTDNNIIITPPSNNEISTPTHYDFKGWSETNPATVENIEDIVLITDFSKYDFTTIPDGEITFYAIYEKHKYQIYFQDPGALTEDKYEVILPVKYGLALNEPALIPARNTEESTLELTERLAFKGWTNLQENAGIVGSEIVNNILVDVTSYKADRNYYFYAVFVKENVFTEPTDNKYFNFEKISSGIEISANPQYQLRGKITLPIQYEGKYITSIGDFTSAVNASHIFFMPNGKYVSVKENAFKEQEKPINLQGVYLPNTIKILNQSAFHGIYTLEHVSENYISSQENTLPDSLETIGSYALSARTTKSGNLKLDKLPSKLREIGSGGFYNAGPGVTFDTLPDSLITVEQSGFAFLPNIKITSTNNLQLIGRAAFGSQSYDLNPTTGLSVEVLTLENAITTISAAAFVGYGRSLTSGGLSVITKTDKVTNANYKEYFGDNVTAFS